MSGLKKYWRRRWHGYSGNRCAGDENPWQLSRWRPVVLEIRWHRRWLKCSLTCLSWISWCGNRWTWSASRPLRDWSVQGYSGHLHDSQSDEGRTGEIPGVGGDGRHYETVRPDHVLRPNLENLESIQCIKILRLLLRFARKLVGVVGSFGFLQITNLAPSMGGNFKNAIDDYPICIDEVSLWANFERYDWSRIFLYARISIIRV